MAMPFVIANATDAANVTGVVTDTSSVVGLHPIVALAVVGVIALAVITRFMDGRGAGDGLLSAGVVCCGLAFVVMVGGALISGIAADDDGGDSSGIPLAEVHPDDSTAEEKILTDRICLLEMQKRQAVNIYQEPELSQKLVAYQKEIVWMKGQVVWNGCD